MVNKQIGISPFSRGEWTGEARTVGDVASDHEWTEDDIDEVIGYDEDDDKWDGTCAGVVKLKDGRYVAWESWWGPTGDGFSMDAYGGNSDFTIAATLDEAVRFGLTDAGRKRLGLDHKEVG
jgi:hypothetical protein